MLLTELLKKMQFRHNESQLQELDDESVDDDVCKLFNCEYCKKVLKNYSRLTID